MQPGSYPSPYGNPAPPPWLVQPEPPGPARGGRRGVRKGPFIGVIAAVALLGTGVFGVNAFARHTICSSLSEGTSLHHFAGDADEPRAGDVVKLREASDELRGYGHMLLFDGELKSAVNGFAGDIDRLADLMGENDGTGSGFSGLVTLAKSMDTHARQAQQACDLPVTGVFNG
ncbi:hypothetical protein HH310_00945 [Actinoplanes sp. TBRC 11911]|uniref:hypothetical protein n=1 Tax=Actinoplanes sp. TBRC 11911 TaxID=2729386 RepID=UPI00145E5A77|nr:hypothetical protein [Actinoplanes sp. TBRC 11911]NMO49767.1 hypothetical protein [Actinoplanes sp. TBRC 11911]